MSRKTKKQKLVAERHRQQQIQFSLSQSKERITPRPPITNPITINHAPFTLPKVSIPVQNFSSANVSSDYSYVISDLKRILTLTVLAFCAQVVLWYFLGR